MNDSLVCVDASLAIKLVIPEVHSERASALWEGWTFDRRVNWIGQVST